MPTRRRARKAGKRTAFVYWSSLARPLIPPEILFNGFSCRLPASEHARILCVVIGCASTLVAVHANRGVIRVPAYALVIRIRILLVCMWGIPRMAGIDAGEHRVIRCVDVAIAAAGPLVRNLKIRMTEDRTQPRGGHPRRVAGGAGCRIRSGHVIRHVCSIGLRVRVVALVAAIAIRCRISRSVIAADMAVRAGVHHWPNRASYSRARGQHVWTLQRKSRCGVIKLSVRPQKRVVARRAHGRGEACRNVIRNASANGHRALPGRLVAAIAIGIRRREVVVVPDVAVRASNYLSCRGQLVRTRQRPARRRVIEGRRQK